MDEINIGELYKAELFTRTISTREYREKYVDREATMKACMECPNYSKNWACPEFKEDVYRYWTKYDNIKLFLTKINFTQKALNNTYNLDELTYIVDNSLFAERMKLIETLEEYEKECNGRYLSAGYCSFCEKCARMEGEECRYPQKCRNSIESLGGLVADTLSGVFDEQLKWIDIEEGKLPINLSLLMALLY